MTTYKITIDYETEIAAKDEEEAKERFYNETIEYGNQNLASFFHELIKIKKINPNTN